MRRLELAASGAPSESVVFSPPLPPSMPELPTHWPLSSAAASAPADAAAALATTTNRASETDLTRLSKFCIQPPIRNGNLCSGCLERRPPARTKLKAACCRHPGTTFPRHACAESRMYTMHKGGKQLQPEDRALLPARTKKTPGKPGVFWCA